MYKPLAKSNGKVYQLTQALRTASNETLEKASPISFGDSVKALRTQLGQTLGIAQVSENGGAI